MKLDILRLGLVLTLGGCSSPKPLEPFDAGTIVDCNRVKGPVDGGADVDAGTKECKPGDICIMVRVHGVESCNSPEFLTLPRCFMPSTRLTTASLPLRTRETIGEFHRSPP